MGAYPNIKGVIMKLAEQLEMDEKFEEAYAEYRKELPHKQGDVDP